MKRGPKPGTGGRPPKDSTEVLHRTPVGFTEGELARLEEQRREGESRSATVRRIALVGLEVEEARDEGK